MRWWRCRFRVRIRCRRFLSFLAAWAPGPHAATADRGPVPDDQDRAGEQDCGLFGGRIAEELIFGEASTGAQNDLVKATDIAKSMVKAYGMSEKLGTVTLERERQPHFMQIPVLRKRGLLGGDRPRNRL